MAQICNGHMCALLPVPAVPSADHRPHPEESGAEEEQGTGFEYGGVGSIRDGIQALTVRRHEHLFGRVGQVEINASPSRKNRC